MFGGSRLGTPKFQRRDIMTRINFYFFGKHKLLTTFVCLFNNFFSNGEILRIQDFFEGMAVRGDKLFQL